MSGTERKTSRIINIIKLVIYITLIVVISIFVRRTKISSVSELRQIIKSYGDMGALIYIGLFSILPTLFVPVNVLAMAAGLVFGFVNASIYTFIASFFNCTISYFVGKYIAHGLLVDIATENYPDIYDKLKKKTSGKDGFIFMLVLRLLPLIPFTFLNYMSGVVGYDYFIFISASLIGIIPGLLAYVNMGSNLDSIGSRSFYISILIFIILIVTTTLVTRLKYGKDFFNGNEKT